MKFLRGLTLFSLLALAAAVTPANAQVTRKSDCLPPPDAAYVAKLHQSYPAGYQFKDPIHWRFTHCDTPPGPGEVKVHIFDSVVEGDASADGVHFQHFQAQAAVAVQVTYNHAAGTSRFFDTEMLQLDIQGGSLPQGVMIRESPTLQSLGQTKIQQVASGFKIDSFFDIFTELSIDGGQTWSAAQKPGHVTLTDFSVKSIKVKPPKVKGGKSFIIVVTLSSAAPASGLTVSLTTTNPAVNIPGGVSVPGGASSVTIEGGTTPVTAVTTGTITATLGASSKSKPITVTP